MLLAHGASEEMAKATIAAEAAKRKEEEVLKKFERQAKKQKTEQKRLELRWRQPKNFWLRTQCCPEGIWKNSPPKRTWHLTKIFGVIRVTSGVESMNQMYFI